MWVQITQIGPYWLIGLAVGSLVSVYLSQGIVDRVCALRGNKFPLISITAATILGIASPLCMYGTVPLIAAFGRKQVPQSALAAFMIGSILLNPNLLLISFTLGTSVAFVRLILCAIAGILAGILTQIFFRDKSIFNFEKFQMNAMCKKKTYFRDLAKAMRITGPYFLVGIVLTAMFDRYIPKKWIASLFGGNRGLGVLLSVSLSVPLYACGGGMIPLMRAWMLAGMDMGSVTAFMIAGPATKITNLGAAKIILGTRNFLLYLGYCLLFAFISGFAINLFV
jgi:uncharacterized membrane protein YraQ (UPF0718 family)